MSETYISKKTHSDAIGTVEEMDVDDKELKDYMKEVVTESMPGANKATPYVEPRRSRNEGTPTDRTTSYSYGGSSNTINIVGAQIGQAAIGNKGPTVFATKKQVFEKGASSQKINISGGNFSQANILGKATYHNKSSTVGGSGDGTLSITPELLTLSILENGVTTEDLASLLERQYTLVNIAFGIPREEARRRRMIDALLLE